MKPNDTIQNAPGREETTGTFGTPDLTQADRDAQQEKLRRRRQVARWAGVGFVLLLLLLMGGGIFIFLRFQSNNKNLSVDDKYAVSSIPLDGLSTGSQSSSGDQSVSKLSVNGNLVVGGKISLSAQAIDDIASGLNGKVTLQGASPGIAQVGNVNIAGTLIAGLVQGSGAGLTNLNASNLSTGIVDNTRLSTTVTKLGQTIPLSAIQPTILSSLNNVVNNGSNIDIVAGDNVTIATDSTNKQIVISAANSGGNITEVVAGSGLQGGGASGSLNYVNTASVTPPGSVVTPSGVNQVQTTSVAASAGVEGIVVVGNTAADKAIIMTNGTAWALSTTSAAAANCAGTSTTAGAVNNVTAAVNVCVGRLKTSAAASTPSVLVRVLPN